MTTEPLGGPAMRERIAAPARRAGRRAAAVRRPRRRPDARRARPARARPRPERGRRVTGPACCSRSSPRATRRASRSSRTGPGSTRTSSRARSRSTRRPAASSPRSPRGRTCAGSCRCSTRRSRTAGVDRRRRRRRSRSRAAPGSRARCSSASTSRRRSRGSTTSRSSASTTSRATSTRAGCWTPARTTREAPPFPLVALVVSGGHTFLVEMRDHLTYRLLGTTVDDAAGEAFDKVGRLLGLGYPGGPAISAAAERATARDRRLPARVAGRLVRLQLLGPQDGRAPDRRGRRAPTAGLPPTRADAAARRTTVLAELAWGFQDSVVDVLATKTIRAAEATGARGIVLGGGVAANAALRARIAGEARGARPPASSCPRPGLCTDNGAMIGAAGARRLAAGDARGPRRSTRRRRCRCREWPRMTAAAMAATASRATSASTRSTSGGACKEAGPPAAPQPVAELPRRRRRARGDPARGRPEPRRAPSSRSGPGSGFLTGGLLAAGAAVTAVELDRGLVAQLRETFAGGARRRRVCG